MKTAIVAAGACLALRVAIPALAAESAANDGAAATVKEDARTAGHAIADGARTVGHEVADKSRAAGHTIAAKSHEAGHAFADAAHEFAKGVAAGAEKLKAAVKHDGGEPAPQR